MNRSPHYPPDDGPCMTRGALAYVDREYPGAFLQRKNTGNSIFYVTVAGAVMEGDPSADKDSPELFAYRSYKQLLGNRFENKNNVTDSAVKGDCLVPECLAHLPGAAQVTIQDCWHSIQAPNNYWYGGDEYIIKKWLPTVLTAMELTRKQREMDL